MHFASSSHYSSRSVVDIVNAGQALSRSWAQAIETLSPGDRWGFPKFDHMQDAASAANGYIQRFGCKEKVAELLPLVLGFHDVGRYVQSGVNILTESYVRGGNVSSILSTLDADHGLLAEMVLETKAMYRREELGAAHGKVGAELLRRAKVFDGLPPADELAVRQAISNHSVKVVADPQLSPVAFELCSILRDLDKFELIENTAKRQHPENVLTDMLNWPLFLNEQEAWQVRMLPELKRRCVDEICDAFNKLGLPPGGVKTDVDTGVEISPRRTPLTSTDGEAIATRVKEIMLTPLRADDVALRAALRGESVERNLFSTWATYVLSEVALIGDIRNPEVRAEAFAHQGTAWRFDFLHKIAADPRQIAELYSGLWTACTANDLAHAVYF